ncbi:hypothetical protein EP7_001205 [Isosphaeraceae bacterium EP7]
MNTTAVTAVWLALVASPGVADDKVKLERAGTLKHPAIREASGLARSRRHPGVFWVINDSGNPPALFAVRADGSLIREYAVEAPNVDWEELIVDDRGSIWIGDIGNNGGALANRAIYRIDEPDPALPAPEGPLPVREAIHYAFDGGKKNRFDAEAFYLDGTSIILITKQFDRRDAVLFRIPMTPTGPSKPAIPVRLGKLEGFEDAATGCSLSDDGRRLAVCWMGGVRVYDRGLDGTLTPHRSLRFIVLDQIESISWDGADLLLAGEFRGVYRIKEATWQAARARAGK